ncbi:MAG: alcohol dehydrogenase [Hyphococcus sp.]|nr:MAG: alcohol dehydrogenase [Marinicaulis sp.]
MTKVRAWAAKGPKEKFEPFEYELGAIGADEVDIDVDYCGLCHSDLSMWNNDWGRTEYPFVGGHEVVGRVRTVGKDVATLKPGQKVGLGWFSRSDLTNAHSIAGDHHLAHGNEGTIVGRYGGFADVVRCQWTWATPLPDDIDITKAGPLFCGGITVFSPIVSFDVKPTDKVGVVGIGGLGHLACQFLNKWGCEVTAFTSSPDKAEEAKKFGAHKTLNSRDAKSWKEATGRFDFLIVTVNVTLDWPRLLRTLAPKGRLHFVGAVPEPVQVHVPSIMGGQNQVSASPLGSPAVIAKMLDFCGRHNITPLTEHFKLSNLNEAITHLEDGKARYRIVLENDF